MADEITNKMILDHLMIVKGDLQEQISHLDKKLTSRMNGLDTNVKSLSGQMSQGFEDARKHRQALQEDLEETIRVLSKHGEKLSRIH